MIVSKFQTMGGAFGCCLAASLLLCSCATTYRPLKDDYGYTDRQLGKDEYEVSFLGNGHSSYERALDLALLRAAEIALEHQGEHFTVADVVHLSSARRYQSSSQYYWTASPYLSNGGAAVPSAPEFTGGVGQSYLMATPTEEKVYYRPGVRLRIRLCGKDAVGGYVYDAAEVRGRLKHKYGLK